MKVKDLITAMALEVLVDGDVDRDISFGYSGDLLSWVMGRAKADSAWITVMGNVNSIAVAVLADCACIILSEGATLDEDAQKRAQQQEVTVLRSNKPSFELAIELGENIFNKQ